jgi:hypothetical protein
LSDDGNYLNAVGPGGCRGENWNKPGWPRFLGRQTLDGCARACAKAAGCTAIHILRPAANATIECLLFGHRRLMAVERLGGFCYYLDDDRLLDKEEAPKVEKIGIKSILSYKTITILCKNTVKEHFCISKICSLTYVKHYINKFD